MAQQRGEWLDFTVVAAEEKDDIIPKRLR